MKKNEKEVSKEVLGVSNAAFLGGSWAFYGSSLVTKGSEVKPLTASGSCASANGAVSCVKGLERAWKGRPLVPRRLLSAPGHLFNAIKAIYSYI